MSAPKAVPEGTAPVTELPGSDTQNSALTSVVAALAAHGSEVIEAVRDDGQRYLAQCPAHEDGKPSLAVFERPNGVGLYCRAGCPTSGVVTALGLSMRDLFSARYLYRDAEGDVTRTVDRTYGADGSKRFRQTGDTKGQPILYRLPEVLAAVAAGRDVYFVEGEKDADTLAALGLEATTAPMGATNVGKVDVAPLSGARVIAVPDEDDAGGKWLPTLVGRLDGVAASVEVRRVAAGKDVTDHIEAGHTLAELVPWRPPVHPRTQAILDAALDASELDSLPEPTPLIVGALNAAEYVLLSGKFGTYKSFVALAWSFAVATGWEWSPGQTVAEPRPVIYVAAEGVSGIRKRLRALERLSGIKAAGMLTVVTRPVRLAMTEEVEGLRLLAERVKPALIVFDTWHRMTPGIEENSATETAVPMDAALSLRDDFAATVVVVHHTGHQQKHARGSSALEDDADAAWIIKLGTGDESEDRGPETPRTLEQRKSKDGELAQPGRLVLAVDEHGEATVSLDPFAAPPVRGRRGRPADRGRDDAVAALVAALDDADVPVSTGYREVLRWASEDGRGLTRVSEPIVKDALKRRRERANGKGRDDDPPEGAEVLNSPRGGSSASQSPDECRGNADGFISALSPAETSSAEGAEVSRSGVPSAPPAEVIPAGIPSAPTLAVCPKCSGSHGPAWGGCDGLAGGAR